MRISTVILLLLCSSAFAAEEQPKPKVAFFPLGGNAKEELRERSC